MKGDRHPYPNLQSNLHHPDIDGNDHKRHPRYVVYKLRQAWHRKYPKLMDNDHQHLLHLQFDKMRWLPQKEILGHIILSLLEIYTSLLRKYISVKIINL